MRIKFAPALIIPLAAIVSSIPTGAIADATVTSKFYTAGVGAPKSATTGMQTVAKYQNGWMRSEQGSTVMLAGPRTTMIIDTAKKQFYAMPADVDPMEGSTEMDMVRKMIKPVGAPKVTKGTTTKVIVGRKVQPTTVEVSLEMTIPREAVSMGGAMGGAAGGSKSAKRVRKSAETIAAQGMKMTMTLKFVVWTCTDPDLANMHRGLPGGLESMMSQFITPEFKQTIAGIQGFPLKTEISQTIGGANPELAKQMKGMPKFTIITEVVKLDTKPLPAALFAAPKGFKQLPYEPGMGQMFGAPGGKP
ncbi:MAG: hypothetical protein RL169_662 [Armatimonadota bacterium]